MLRVRHVEKVSFWEVRSEGPDGLKRADAVAAAVRIIAQNRVERFGINDAAVTGEQRELDPNGWSAAWVTNHGGVEREESIKLPPLPPLRLNYNEKVRR